MSIKIRGMKWPSEKSKDMYWSNKDAKEGVVITALPGKPKNKEDKGMEI